MSSVAIVLLNHNGLTFLKSYLPSLLAHSKGYRIFVVDNASIDGSLAYVQSQQLPCIVHPTNYGFAKGYNLALSQIEATYYVLLNNDLQVTPHWLEPLLALMEQDDSIAFCQPKICSLNEPGQFDYAGAAGGFIDQDGYPFCRGRIFHHLEKDHGQYDDTRPIFWASGAALLARAAAFHTLGGFDERFFAHFEEIDLCWRAHSAGWKVYYCASSKVFHLGGGTIAYHNSEKTYLNFRNRALMMYKHKPHYGFLLKRLILDGIAALRMLFLGKVAHSWAICKAQIDFLKLKQKGKTLPIPSLAPIYRGSIVWDFFIKRKKWFSELSATRFRE